MKKLKNKGIFIFVAACVILYVIIYVVPKLTGLMTVTYSAEYGELSINDVTTGYLVRSEKVYTAVESGAVTRVKNEGDLVRVGTAPVTVESGTALEPSEQLTSIKDKLGENVLAVSGYYVQTGGIVSYYTDGYEAELTPDTIQNFDYSYFSAITQDSVVSLDSGSCRTDYPIFKVISNGGWRLVAFVPVEHAERYTVGNTVRVIFDPDDGAGTSMAESEAGAIAMDVVSVEKGSENVKLVLGCDMYFDDLGKYRAANVRIVSDSVRGLLLSSGSITEKDGKRGVYLKDKKGKYYFIQVEEIGTDGNITAVTPSQFYDEEGNLVRTLDPYDDVLKDPSDAIKSEAGS